MSSFPTGSAAGGGYPAGMARRRTLLWILMALVGCSRTSPGGSPSQDGGTVAYPSPNQLIRAHYPADFAARIVGKSVIQLTRALPDEEFDTVLLISVASPISDDVKEFSRVIELAEEKKRQAQKRVFTEQVRRTADCLGSQGVEIQGTQMESTGPYQRWSCSFIRQGHGYSFVWLAPAHLPDHFALLKQVVAQTEFVE